MSWYSGGSGGGVGGEGVPSLEEEAASHVLREADAVKINVHWAAQL